MENLEVYLNNMPSANKKMKLVGKQAAARAKDQFSSNLLYVREDFNAPFSVYFQHRAESHQFYYSNFSALLSGASLALMYCAEI